MATDNKGVMVYLPPDLEEVLEKYCTENNITRKNRDGEPVPSMGTGIVQYLKSHLLGISLGNISGTGLTRDEVLELIKNSGTSNVPDDGLSIDRVTEIARSEVELVTAPIFDDLLNLQSQLAEVKNDCDLTTEGIQRLIDNAIAKMSIGTNRKKSQKVASNNPSEGISISLFSQRHGLEISRSTPAGEVRAVLVEKGLDSDWQYDARNGRFNPIEYVNMANS